MAINLADKDYLIKRLESKTTKLPNGCWLWAGNKTRDGHGIISIFNVKYPVSRLIAILILGLNEKDLTLQANHKDECFNPNCWNPDHIYVGTHQQNMEDKARLGNSRNKYNTIYKNTCANGHPQNEDNTYMDNRGHRKCRLCARERYRKADIKRGRIEG